MPRFRRLTEDEFTRERLTSTRMALSDTMADLLDKLRRPDASLLVDQPSPFYPAQVWLVRSGHDDEPINYNTFAALGRRGFIEEDHFEDGKGYVISREGLRALLHHLSEGRE